MPAVAEVRPPQPDADGRLIPLQTNMRRKAMNISSVFAVIIAFALTVFGEKAAIPMLHRFKFGQEVRDDGPQSHLKKQGTPTMGGIVFDLAILVTGLIFAPRYPRVLPVLFLTMGFGLTGFLDDYLKIAKHRSEGLTVKQKFAIQLVVTALFCVYMVAMSPTRTLVKIPFTSIEWNMGWLYVPLLFLVVLGTDNGTNFTDGVDGLCASVTLPVAAFFTVASAVYGTGIEPVAAAVMGAMMGFLVFNAHPAKVFMGDTGSLALGGFVAGSALMLGQPFMIIIVGFIYLIEVISVMIQVAYFKKTHGKRFFRMAPIHHHFELGGWSEGRVVAVFMCVTVILCLVGWLGI